jgi:hypothetical protein
MALWWFRVIGIEGRMCGLLSPKGQWVDGQKTKEFHSTPNSMAMRDFEGC